LWGVLEFWFFGVGLPWEETFYSRTIRGFALSSLKVDSLVFFSLFDSGTTLRRLAPAI